LDGEPVMAMFRRSPKSPSALRRRQEEIARTEAELREKVEKLESIVINGPQGAEETSAAPGEKRRQKNNAGDKQLQVSVALEDRHYFDKSGSSRRRPRSMRKERREGRMVFLLLVAALAAAIIWLMSHLHF
jgi:hypothetical protein